MELDKLFIQYPECVLNEKTLHGYLRDLFPSEIRKVNLIMNAYRLGIIEKMKKANTLDCYLYNQMLLLMSDTYGVSEENSKWAVTYWFESYGVSVLCKKTIHIDDNKKVNVQDTSEKKVKVQNCSASSKIYTPNAAKNKSVDEIFYEVKNLWGNVGTPIKKEINKPIDKSRESEYEYKLSNGRGFKTTNNGRKLIIRYEAIDNTAQLQDMRRLEHLILFGVGMTHMRDVAALINLTNLNLCYNSIVDITPVRQLTKLKELYLFNNNISNIQSLSALSELSILKLCHNKITDISPLRNLRKLKVLDISNNMIHDFSVLKTLKNLEELTIGGGSDKGDMFMLAHDLKKTNKNLKINVVYGPNVNRPASNIRL